MRYAGACHCGAIRFGFESERPLAPRACRCSFCRMHGARTVSDPEGSAWIEWDLEPLRYRFASHSAEYLLCSRCGVYLGAVFGRPEARLATLNLNAFDEPHSEIEPEPVTYEGESAEGKGDRRRLRWTPLQFRIARTKSQP